MLRQLKLCCIAVATGAQNLFVQDGKEYVFKTQAVMIAGTMDHAAHSSGVSARMKTRMQVSGGGKTLSVKVKSLPFNMHVFADPLKRRIFSLRT